LKKRRKIKELTKVFCTFDRDYYY